MFERMRAVFSLRNDGSDTSIDILSNGFNSNSALRLTRFNNLLFLF